MSTPEKASKRAEMPEGSAPILENRSLHKDYRTLLPLLIPGQNVLDVGCGSGTMTADMARITGDQGTVLGVDNSPHLIERGRQLYADVKNLELLCADIFDFSPDQQFNLVTAARVLQWLQDPAAAISTLISFIKPGGLLSVLDYDHNDIEFDPEPPASMRYFYSKFLQWRSDAGMDNSMALHLPVMFQNAGLENIQVLPANQTYKKGEKDFEFKVGIWSDVAASRGVQMVEEDYLKESERQLAMAEYSEWVSKDALSMTMKLSDVRGYKPAT